MASRAEGVAPVRAGPFRAALTDYYFDSLRLVRANLVWGASVILVVLVGIGWPVGGLIMLSLLALPTAGVFRTAARIVRADHSADGELRWPYGRVAGRLVVVGASLVGAGVIAGWNVVVGLGQGGPLGWAFATLAGWGLVALWCVALVLWPILVDPTRPDRPLRDGLSLAARVLLLEPRRVAGLAVVVAVVVVVSIVLTAALLTVSVAFAALVACRSVYPLIDRLEATSTVQVGPTG